MWLSVCRVQKIIPFFLEMMRVERLPREFLARMERLLGKEFPAFEAGCGFPAFRGIHLNTLKCGFRTLSRSFPFDLIPAPFSPLEYYLPQDAKKIGQMPLHHAGAFYVQEPSASSAVTALNPQPGEKILDLCAAPGGKSTQIGALLGGRGLLWSNEVVRSRTDILLSNLERMGIANAVVSCCQPEKLCRTLAGWFDRVLVDAPCSGEGMFRKGAEAVRAWSPEHVASCAARQLAILNSAGFAVKENGVLVYSTCTFSEEEDEGVISAFLKEHEDFELAESGLAFGRPALLPQACRIFPMDGGEGHFVAVLRRNSANPSPSKEHVPLKGRNIGMAEDLYGQIFRSGPIHRIEERHESFFLLPDILPDLDGLNVLRAGVLLGRLHPGRVEPEHALFMASKPQELNCSIDLTCNSSEIHAFLRGEELAVETGGMRGYAGVSVEGVMVGFGKCSAGRLKNKYPKGLRNPA